jgi:hypothetical protein
MATTGNAQAWSGHKSNKYRSSNYNNHYSNNNHYNGYRSYSSSYRGSKNRNNYYNSGRHNSYRNYNRIGHRSSYLPLGYLALSLAGLNYYYHSGAYYQRVGHEYAVIRPPLGIGISILPAGYRTHHYGGHNYYSASGVFYHWDKKRRNYIVVADPGTQVANAATSPASTAQFVYPRQGQNPTQTSRDQYECYLWAVEQTGVEPSQLKEVNNRDDLDDYQRANGACLEARGYSVK